jgi:hypothetical protein
MMKKRCALAGLLAVSGVAFAGTPTIDGTLDAAAGYVALGTVNAPGDDEGFGGSADASAIYFTEDATNIYLFVQGRVPTGNSDGLMLVIGTSGQTGLAAGSAGVGVSGAGGHAFGAANDQYKFDFEVDHAWVGNTGSSGSNFWIDEVNLVGTRATSFVGNPGQSGGTATGGNVGATHSFNNAGASGGLGSSTGWEVSIPRSSLGGIGVGATVQAMAIIVSSTAFFSSDAAPTIVPGGNPGNNPDFVAITGTFNGSTTTTVPVELDLFMID